MSIFEQLSEALKPHTDQLNKNLAFHASLIHQRLQAIENAVLVGGRGDIGNKWQRMQVKKKFTEGEVLSLGACPINEMWLIQGIATDGVQEKSPAFVILANGLLVESVIKEGIGFEGVGGNQIILPGEELTVVARTEGSINCVITFIRKPYPVQKFSTDYGSDSDQYSPRTTHEIHRDLLPHKVPETFDVDPQLLEPTTGRSD